MENKIGFWGVPHPKLVEQLNQKYPNAEWIDLDIDFGNPDSNILPESYCKIIKNIINNSLALKSELVEILAPIGKDKCDSGWFASELLKDMGFKVTTSIFEEKNYYREPLISQSNLPLFDKVNLIMNNVVNPDYPDVKLEQTKAEFGFWGVPPNDLEILKLFPDTTHIYGWTRCADAKTPSDIELEMYINPDVPTVFYAQAFCSKCQLAKYLAEKYNGLYVDIDDFANNSIRAKIEAFLRLR